MRGRPSGGLIDYANSAGNLPADNPFVIAAREGRPDVAQQLTATRKGRKRPSESAEGGRGGSRGGGSRRRVTNRRKQHSDPPPPRVARSNPFDFDEDNDENKPKSDTHASGATLRRSSSGNRYGVWIVLTLLVTVVAILAFFGFKQLS